MNNNYDNTDMKTVNNEGFVTSAFWDKSIHLQTVDENGNSIDCYDKVVDDLKTRENKAIEHFKKEERKNSLINYMYNSQRRMLIVNILITFITFFMYIVLVGFGKLDIIYKVDKMIADNLYAPIYKKMCQIDA